MGIRAAVLGYGRSGSTMHAGAIEACDAYEMAAVCDIDPERRQQAAERFGCPVYEDHHEMLRAEELDLVCVITRSDQHAAMTCDCLEAGANVLVTKPWAANAGEAERMVATQQSTGKTLLPWLPARWGCDLRRLKDLVAGGAVGKPFLVRRVVNSFATRNDWQTKRAHAGGYLLNWGAHIVDPPLQLLGQPVQSVYGCMRQLINPGDAEDLFMAVMTLADGSMVQAEYTIAVDEMPTWVVQGDGGTITVRGMDVTVHSSTPQRPGDPTQFETMQSEGDSLSRERLEGNPYGDEHEIYAELAAAVRGEAEQPVPTADALKLSRLFDAIRLSSEENRVVSLDGEGVGR